MEDQTISDTVADAWLGYLMSGMQDPIDKNFGQFTVSKVDQKHVDGILDADASRMFTQVQIAGQRGSFHMVISHPTRDYQLKNICFGTVALLQDPKKDLPTLESIAAKLGAKLLFVYDRCEGDCDVERLGPDHRTCLEQAGYAAVTTLEQLTSLTQTKSYKGTCASVRKDQAELEARIDELMQSDERIKTYVDTPLGKRLAEAANLHNACVMLYAALTDDDITDQSDRLVAKRVFTGGRPRSLRQLDSRKRATIFDNVVIHVKCLEHHHQARQKCQTAAPTLADGIDHLFHLL
jgi:hypothetical protein